ncbi:DUF2201 family putative metallopeptidase [Chromobacterium piscinae]|uniref:DUF2201 family putative metallopeptidase n=1 Tax=Chromobacterium piscinae TaxID=686831 RepID=UPI003F7E2FE4
MLARISLDANGTEYGEVIFNPNFVKRLSPAARYFVILHELAHLLHQHPGNHVEESADNEYQADSTALINAITRYPLMIKEFRDSIVSVIDNEIQSGNLGGGSHPKNTDRRERIILQTEKMLNSSILSISIECNFVQKDVFDAFIRDHKRTLKIDSNDFVEFKASNGTFSYLKGWGEMSLNDFTEWANYFAIAYQSSPQIPKLRYIWEWKIGSSPSEVLNL